MTALKLVPAPVAVALLLLVAGCGPSERPASEGKADTAARASPSGADRAAGRRAKRHRRGARARRRATASARRLVAGTCPPPGRVLEGVYHPERLEVLNRCKRLSGRVTLVRSEEDGDLHFDVELDRRDRGLLLPGNLGQQDGALVVEFMPRDGGHLRAPAVGNRVRMVGALVNDTQHNWAELHPVWAIQINGGRWSRSGPRFGGSPPQDRSYNAAGDCTTPRGAACRGYGGTAQGGYRRRRRPHPRRAAPGGSGGGCAQGYSPCLPVAGDLNCSDIPADKKPVRVTGSDPYGLDRDRDGSGCDS